MALAVAVAVLPLVAQGTASAKARHYTVPPGRFAHLSVEGSRGYRITIDRSRDGVILTANRRGSSVTYFAKGPSGGGDGIDARFPGVGRVLVRFKPVGKPRKTEAICAGAKPIQQPGIFRGTIAFRGERGFTRVNTGHASGYVEKRFREVCRESGHRGHSPAWPGIETYSRSHNRLVSLDVFEIPRPTGVPAPIPAMTFYSATVAESRRGMAVFRTVSRTSTKEGSFTIEPSDRPETATISPPAPFHGTATFDAAPGEVGNWEGAISVELPGAGAAQLTGAAFETELCLGRRCVGEIQRSRGRSAAVLVTAAPR